MPSTLSQTLTFLTVALLPGGLRALRAQETLPGILPGRSTPEVDSLLQRLEREYEEMDVDGFVSLFTEDFTQHDVNRRVRISGIEAWR